MKVTDIQELLDRETVANASLTQPLEELRVSHPDADFTIHPSIADPQPDDIGCRTCDCATVGVMEPRTRKKVRVCRDIIRALKLASLVQVNPNQVQIYYKLRYIDDLPLLSSQCLDTHTAELRIAASLMEIDDDSDLIIHDLTHLDTEHCPGINCQRKIHPGCFDDCPDLVQKI